MSAATAVSPSTSGGLEAVVRREQSYLAMGIVLVPSCRFLKRCHGGDLKQ
jgi:hypothetical protein